MRERERHKRLTTERWLHTLRRKDKTRGPTYSGSPQESGDAFEHTQYLSRILSRYQRFVPFKRRAQRREQFFAIPEDFSLTNNPEAALAFYSNLIAYARTAKTPKITIDHRPIRKLGLAADSVLAVLIKEITLEIRRRPKTYVRGLKAKNNSVRKLMEEIGCVRVLDNARRKDDPDIKIELRSGAKVFRHQNRKNIKIDALELDPLSAVARDFADHLNASLASVGRRLTDAGMQHLLAYVGEILANAQEHSLLSEWTIVGYVDLEGEKADDQLTYRCSILSFGKTFFETFDELDRDSYAYQQIAPYVELHQTKFVKNWRKEDLVALLALQGYVSCRQESSNGDRGQGTVDFIEFFQNVCRECAGFKAKPRMSVLTGRTLFIFDGSYQMKQSADNRRMTIAFNANNSLLECPDPEAVKALERYFPGVVISISIPITPSVLEVAHGNNDEN